MKLSIKHDSMCTVFDGYEGYGCVDTCAIYKETQRKERLKKEKREKK